MRQHENSLLSRIEPAMYEELAKHAVVVEMTQGERLADAHSIIQRVHFPHSGIISCVVELAGGGAIETGMIGRDGEFGAGLALDDKVSLNHAAVQVGGLATTFDANFIAQFAEKILRFAG